MGAGIYLPKIKSQYVHDPVLQVYIPAPWFASGEWNADQIGIALDFLKHLEAYLEIFGRGSDCQVLGLPRCVRV